MAEEDIDIANRVPHAWADAGLGLADVVVTMGCGDACPFSPGQRHEDWDVADPGDRTLKEVRLTRDNIKRRVRGLFDTLGIGRT